MMLFPKARQMLRAQVQSPSPSHDSEVFPRPPGDTDTSRPQLSGAEIVLQHQASRLPLSPPQLLIPPPSEVELVTKRAAGVVIRCCKLSPFE